MLRLSALHLASPAAGLAERAAELAAGRVLGGADVVYEALAARLRVARNRRQRRRAHGVVEVGSVE